MLDTFGEGIIFTHQPDDLSNVKSDIDLGFELVKKNGSALVLRPKKHPRTTVEFVVKATDQSEKTDLYEAIHKLRTDGYVVAIPTWNPDILIKSISGSTISVTDSIIQRAAGIFITNGVDTVFSRFTLSNDGSYINIHMLDLPISHSFGTTSTCGYIFNCVMNGGVSVIDTVDSATCRLKFVEYIKPDDAIYLEAKLDVDDNQTGEITPPGGWIPPGDPDPEDPYDPQEGGSVIPGYEIGEYSIFAVEWDFNISVEIDGIMVAPTTTVHDSPTDINQTLPSLVSVRDYGQPAQPPVFLPNFWIGNKQSKIRKLFIYNKTTGRYSTTVAGVYWYPELLQYKIGAPIQGYTYRNVLTFHVPDGEPLSPSASWVKTIVYDDYVGGFTIPITYGTGELGLHRSNPAFETDAIRGGDLYILGRKTVDMHINTNLYPGTSTTVAWEMDISTTEGLFRPGVEYSVWPQKFENGETFKPVIGSKLNSPGNQPPEWYNYISGWYNSHTKGWLYNAKNYIEYVMQAIDPNDEWWGLSNTTPQISMYDGLYPAGILVSDLRVKTPMYGTDNGLIYDAFPLSHQNFLTVSESSVTRDLGNVANPLDLRRQILALLRNFALQDDFGAAGWQYLSDPAGPAGDYTNGPIDSTYAVGFEYNATDVLGGFVPGFTVAMNSNYTPYFSSDQIGRMSKPRVYINNKLIDIYRFSYDYDKRGETVGNVNSFVETFWRADAEYMYIPPNAGDISWFPNSYRSIRSTSSGLPASTKYSGMSVQKMGVYHVAVVPFQVIIPETGQMTIEAYMGV